MRSGRPEWMSRGLLGRIIDAGTAGWPRMVAQRIRLTNGLNLFLILSYIAYSVTFALIDWDRYALASLANLAVVPFWLVTPFLHRLSEVAAPIYICLVNAVALPAFVSMVGPQTGIHYNLLAVPAVLLLLGSRRIALATLLTVLVMGIFAAIQFGFWRIEAMIEIPVSTLPIRIVSLVIPSVIVLASLYFALRASETAEEALEAEYARSENLIHNLMPTSIAERLKAHPDEIIADQFDAVTILFADIVDFTPRSARLRPAELVGFLNRVFSAFDQLAEKHGLEKIKTIGDAYMVAGGMPEKRPGHAQAVAEMALDMLAATAAIAAETGEDLAVRIGIHTGPAVAGVIGARKLFYDVWGDTVNTASRMESHGSAGRIQVTREAKEALGARYLFEPRGTVEIKGKGPMELYYLTGRAGEARPAGAAP